MVNYWLDEKIVIEKDKIKNLDDLMSKSEWEDCPVQNPRDFLAFSRRKINEIILNGNIIKIAEIHYYDDFIRGVFVRHHDKKLKKLDFNYYEPIASKRCPYKKKMVAPSEEVLINDEKNEIKNLEAIIKNIDWEDYPLFGFSIKTKKVMFMANPCILTLTHRVFSPKFAHIIVFHQAEKYIFINYETSITERRCPHEKRTISI